jgi:hypothetical protein
MPELKMPGLEEYVLLNVNYLANRFPCTENNYKEILCKYFFIGIIERLQEDFNKLGGLIDKPGRSLKILNKTTRDDQTISEAARLEFRRRNKLDYNIYNYTLYRRFIQSKPAILNEADKCVRIRD